MLDFPIAVDALQQHCESLRSLALYNTGATDPAAANSWVSASLRGFDKLEKAYLDASVLLARSSWGALRDLLPASMEDLYLVNTWLPLVLDCQDLEGTLSTLEDKASFPVLEYVRITISEESRVAIPALASQTSDAESVVSRLRNHGIDFHYRSEVGHDYNDPTWAMGQVAYWHDFALFPDF